MLHLKKRSRGRWATVAAGSALALLLTSCGGGEEEPEATGGGSGGGDAAAEGGAPSMDELYEAAQADGEDTVVVYGIKTGEACYQQFSEEFPGIEVQSQYIVGETQARLQQEHVSGQNVADLLRTGNTTMIALIQDGILTEFVPETAEDFPEAAFGPENAMINDTQRMSGIAYNTANVSEENAPTGWQDLVDPRFKGRIVMPDPTSPGAGLSTLQALLETGGETDEEWLRALAANEPALIRGVQPTIEALRSGEYDVMFGGLDQVTGPQLEEGTEIEYVFPVEGATPLSKHYTGLITNAPHPNAAKLLYTWLLSEEGQTCLAEEESEMPVRPGIAPPEGVPPLDELENVAVQEPATAEELEKQQAYLAQFQEIFGG